MGLTLTHKCSILQSRQDHYNPNKIHDRDGKGLACIKYSWNVYVHMRKHMQVCLVSVYELICRWMFIRLSCV